MPSADDSRPGPGSTDFPTEIAPRSPLPREAADPFVGQRLGKCQIERRIGAGGMGTVYLARHLSLGIPVAVKVLPHNLAVQAELVERFQREAQAAARLSHPGIVRVLDTDCEGATFYIIMEYVEGQSLQDRLAAEGAFPVAEAVRIAASAAAALAAAHREGLVHRDIKPALVRQDCRTRPAEGGPAGRAPARP